MKSSPIRSSPAKIAPPEPPKEISIQPSPRCAMQESQIDQPNL
jgi:hypothetical protein